jgi:hypothetical protein
MLSLRCAALCEQVAQATSVADGFSWHRLEADAGGNVTITDTHPSTKAPSGARSAEHTHAGDARCRGSVLKLMASVPSHIGKSPSMGSLS